MIKSYVRVSVGPRLGARLLAWEGLADTGADDDTEETQERNSRLRHEMDLLRERQHAGELGADGGSPEVVEHYAEQLARLIRRLGRDSATHPTD